VTEPLALEYLAAVANEEQCDYRIHDPSVTRRAFAAEFRDFRPDIVGITGFYSVKDKMLAYARSAKARDPSTLTVIGGVHAEINHEDFYDDSVDLVVHSGGTESFRRILQAAARREDMENIAGTCHRTQAGRWQRNRRAHLDVASLPLPDRTHFYRYFGRFSYLDHGPVAIVKTAYGCPFQCSFCYCRLLNEGAYEARPVANVVDEIASIECDRVWIVDDTFLIDVERVKAFANLMAQRGVRKQFIIYSRADFIADNEQMLPVLKNMGVSRWIARNQLTECAVSVFTPIPGTEAYEESRDKLTTTDCRKWDLLHLVMQPSNLSRPEFYFRMARTYLKAFVKHSSVGRHVRALLKPRGRNSV